MDSNKEFLIQEVLQKDENFLGRDVLDKLKYLRHERTSVPLIFVGTSGCGLIAGADKTLEKITQYIETVFPQPKVIEIGCVGICSMEPLVEVQLPGKNRLVFKNVMADNVQEVLDGAFNNTPIEEFVLGQFMNNALQMWENVPFIDQLPFFKLQKKIVTELCGKIDPSSIEEYIAWGGYRSLLKTIYHYTTDEVCNLMEKSGLRGRGGSGFNTGVKWKIAHNTAAEQKYLICNCNESDPGASIDKSLLESNPHLAIEGVAIAAYAIGAGKAYIYIRHTHTRAIELIKLAIKQAKEYGLLGENIFDSGFNLDIIVKSGPGAFVCGEETAMIHSIEGRKGLPRPRPPYPTESGLFGKPTVVNSLETLVNVPFILKHGPQWYQTIGTETSKGTKIFNLSGKVAMPGLIEVEMGTNLKSIIFEIGAGVKNNLKFKALQIGGPAGKALVEEDLSMGVDYDELQNGGVLMGSGGLVVLDESTCMVDMTRFYIDFIQKESCGKCIPCREGTRRMLEILENITKRPKDETSHQTLERFKGVMQLEKLAEVIRDTSLCGLGKAAPNIFTSTLKRFREEYEEHIFDRKCRANVCKELRSYLIDVDKCTGCNACMRRCPVNAIIGTVKYPHFIVAEKCIGCGICFDTCKFSAISIK